MYQGDAALVLPLGDGAQTTRAAAFVLNGEPKSNLNKYWVRADGFPYFVCPYRANLKSPEPQFERIILSLDPNWRDPDYRLPLSLRGLGHALELAECAARGSHDERAKVPRWPEATNDDPWYDGRGHDYTIIDAPRCGTVLPYETVKAIATGRFFEVPLARVDIAVVVPNSEVRVDAEVLGTPLALPTGLAKSLAGLYEAWQELPSVPPKSLPDLAELGVQVRAMRRLPPARIVPLAPALEIVQIGFALEAEGTTNGQRLTLEQVVAWVEELNRLHEDSAYVMADVRIAAGYVRSAYVENLMTRLCLGRTERATEAGAKDLILFSGRAIAVHPADDQPLAQQRRAVLRELLIYAAFQAETLAGFNRAIALGVNENSLEIADLNHLRLQFMTYQTKYVELEPVHEFDQRFLFKAICDGLGLDAQRAKLNDAIERLEQFERDRIETRMNHLLFAVGLTAIVQTAIADDWGDVKDIKPFQIHAAIAGVVLSIMWYAWVQWRRGPGKP